LLDSWLNLLDNSEENGVQLKSCPARISFELPKIEKGIVSYSYQEIELGPGEAIPIKLSSKKERVIEGRWPPEGFPLPTVSPSEESRQHAGLMKHVDNLGENQDIPVFEHASSAGGSRCMALLGRWPEPFTDLFPLGGGHDAILCQVQTKKVAKTSFS